MSEPTWQGAPEENELEITALGWVRLAIRSVFIIATILIGVMVSLPLKLWDALANHHSAGIVRQAVCKICLRLLGLSVSVEGRVDQAARLIVANHVSWLDIFVVNACVNGCFVAKSEVRRWPGIGPLARFGGTEFINRGRGATRDEMLKLDMAIEGGKRLILFPEGTSSDGLGVLPFRSSMLQICYSEGWHADWAVQAMSLHYVAPRGASPRFYGWWGDMSFGVHLLKILAAAPQGHVSIAIHDAHLPAHVGDRKALTQRLQAQVAGGFAQLSARS